MSHILNYPVFDADNHMYETTDAFTKYLPREYEGLVKYVQVNGRTKIALRNVISEYIPNPTFNKVAPPGRQEMEFRLKNPSSKHSVGTGGFDIGSAQKADPRLASHTALHRVATWVLQSRGADRLNGRAEGRPGDDVAHPGQPARRAARRRSEGHGGSRTCPQ